ncbi:hypothetical protein [Aequorivita marina]|uniref:hypothetical protein n=1 Tax=Aequorivita marina TaxID=3073654 RepID=UPI002874FE95|nr:hypothetical protein [Aequorivita sp. S2608]MDS1299190.1 hypothetical protein [Aequorivita sp. S2608]
MKVKNEDNLILLASYMFNCANTAIHFFDSEYKKIIDKEFKSHMDGLYIYKKYSMVSGN